MSHQGLQILYRIINSREDLLAERCFSPDVDMERQLRKRRLPLFSLESRTPLDRFDVIGITLPYELCYTNILTLLDLASIPLYSHGRGDDHPLVLGGGSCSLNPEPVADFFDAVVLGDGEEVILEIADTVIGVREAGGGRSELLAALAEIEGVYVPSFFIPRYRGGKISALRSLRPGYTRIRRRVITRLADPDLFREPLVPMVKTVHDRLGIEVARGCTRGCRFCQAGILYRPVRERSVDEVMELAESGIAAGGFDELALLSLSTGDYSCLNDLLGRLMDRFVRRHVSVSLPSMRVGSLTTGMMEQIRRVRKTGFTVAPEAGSRRLRRVINKGISEDDLLATCRDAFALGWNLIKFYFMIGLPTETREDVEAVIELAVKARQAGLEETRGKRAPRINVSVATFVPKPHTPFQWEKQLGPDESLARLQLLKDRMPRRGLKLKWHDPRQSFMEGVFSRGDRRLARLIEIAWADGARFDGWSDHFQLKRWQRAAADCGIDLEQYLEARRTDEMLPWDHLDPGVERRFLLDERQKGFDQVYTADCRNHGCHGCGLCDFRTLKPLVHRKAGKTVASGTGKAEKTTENQPLHCYRVHYARLGDIRFLSHLEMLQLIFRAIQRAGLPVAFSRGFNPSPRVSFGSALGVGMESEDEYFDMKLTAPLGSISRATSRLNRELPSGLTILNIEICRSGKEGGPTVYEIECPTPLTATRRQRIRDFLAVDSFAISRRRKKKVQRLDIRPLVREISLRGDRGLHLELLNDPMRAGVRPVDILSFVLELPEEEVLTARIRKRAPGAGRRDATATSASGLPGEAG